MKQRARVLAAAGVAALVVAGVLATGVLYAQSRVHAGLLRSDPERVLDDPTLRSAALDLGRDVFVRHCASCHGMEGKGSTMIGVPDLTDDDFLYGSGRVGEIEQIVLHGIRSRDSNGYDLASMPAFGQAVPYARGQIEPLSPRDIKEVVSFLRAENGAAEDPRAVAAGRALFGGRGGCWDCHAHDARGDQAIGAPNLLRGKWLKGDGSEAALFQTVAQGLSGVSPAFRGRLDALGARAVSVYVSSLHPQRESK